jgi:hypothetical protein
MSTTRDGRESTGLRWTFTAPRSSDSPTRTLQGLAAWVLLAAVALPWGIGVVLTRRSRAVITRRRST